MSTKQVNRVWFITGCSTGFGRALAEAVLARGEHVIATARKREHVQELEDRFPDHARALALDVTDAAQVRAVADTAIGLFGGVDVLVNNAGYGMLGAVEEISTDEAQAQFATNVFGVLAVLQAFLPHMRERRRGHVLNVSSVSGFVARAGTGIYSASKFALEALSESLAQEVAPLGIRVTIVEPGVFRTDFAGRSLQVAETVIDDYTATAGATRTTVQQVSGRQPGDPARGAAAIIAAVDAETPPLRLILGSDALGRIRTKLAAVAQDANTWEATSVGTDFL